MSAIVRIKINYAKKELFKELSSENYQKVRTILPDLDLPKQQDDINYGYGGESIIDSDDLNFLSNLGIECVVKHWKSMIRIPGFSEPTDSLAMHVHLPGLGVLAMTEVMNLDDACTDQLQEHLNEGWRILAVCPQLAQRRPDYILGRSKI